MRILHWLETSNFKIYRSSGRMPLEGQVRRFGGVALRKLAILDAAACVNDLSIQTGNRLEPPRSASLPFLGLSKGFWLRMQSSHGLRVKNRPLGESST